MEIKDLQPRQGNVEITAEVIEKGEVREFQKFGKEGRVCNAKIKDASGEIALTLWNEQIEQVNVGDTVHISNGYVNEWQGEPQLTTGKFGTLEIVGKTPGEEPKSEEVQTGKDEPTEEESSEGKKEAPSEEEPSEDDLTEQEIDIEEEKVD